MIILEGQIPHTCTHYTKHKIEIRKKKERKKIVEKERQKFVSIEQRKARKNIVLINLQLIFINNNAQLYVHTQCYKHFEGCSLQMQFFLFNFCRARPRDKNRKSKLAAISLRELGAICCRDITEVRTCSKPDVTSLQFWGNCSKSKRISHPNRKSCTGKGVKNRIKHRKCKQFLMKCQVRMH